MSYRSYSKLPLYSPACLAVVLFASAQLLQGPLYPPTQESEAVGGAAAERH